MWGVGCRVWGVGCRVQGAPFHGAGNGSILAREVDGEVGVRVSFFVFLRILVYLVIYVSG